jgi:hypothetical protein
MLIPLYTKNRPNAQPSEQVIAIFHIPLVRDGSFKPDLIKKGQARIGGMDDKIPSFTLQAYRPAFSAPIWMEVRQAR